MIDAADNKLGEFLDKMLALIPETYDAVLYSEEGLRVAHSMGINRPSAEVLSAAMTGVRSLSQQSEIAKFCRNEKGPWRKTLMEIGDGFVLIAAAGAGTYLAVATTCEVDLEVLTTQVQYLVKRIGKELAAPDRFPAGQEPGNPT